MPALVSRYEDVNMDPGAGDYIEHEAADCVIAPLQPSGVDVATLSSAAAGPSSE